MLCFYNSKLDKIILEDNFMVIPLYDKMINRGYSIFDTVNVRNRKFINL